MEREGGKNEGAERIGRQAWAYRERVAREEGKSGEI
jgi:hypothetical protein